ncbi:hypothetical protein LSUE1_G010006 [Lachnellula suecica]|uniref:Uncharacterized protein n=1 Tax=Lachnellula suecica TaxID=602035 RepID=A0A8T9C230_9HELO|nr:hypothetical protein LSUE1_G010006 [Lachnellula suecica]
MLRSPPPKRKPSPTPSIPDAPTTPNRIPVPARDVTKILSERRPSFASPTKASIARHNPQLLNRPPSAGTGADRPGSRGKNLNDVFAKALGEVQNALASQAEVNRGGTQVEAGVPATQGSSNVPETPRATTPRARRLSVGGPLSAKPRRMSRTPSKRPERTVQADVSIAKLQEKTNPFEKKGLRRSPMSSQVETQPTEIPDDLAGIENPFKKTGLRRSPISSQPVGSFEQAITQIEDTTTPPGPAPTLLGDPISFKSIERPEKDSVASGAQSPVLQSAEPIVMDEPPEVEKSSAPGNASRRRVSRVAALGRSSPPDTVMGSGDYANDKPQEQVAATPEEPLYQAASPAKITRSRDSLYPEQEAAERSPSPAKAARSSKPHQSEVIEPELPPSPGNVDQSRNSPQPEAQLPLSPAKVNQPRNPRQSEVEEPEFPFSPAKLAQPREVRQPSLEIQLSPAKGSQSLRPRRPEPEEPELPPTPTQRGVPDPIVTTPPTGIHDTPSKKARRNRSLGDKLKSSPLKPRNPSPLKPAKEKEVPIEKEPEPEVQPIVNREKSKRRQSARFLIPEDPHASKKQARDDLLKELQQLQADVALANRENERLRLHQESGKRRPTAAPNADDLIALLRRSTEQLSVPKPKTTSIFKSIGSFLPFSSRRRPQPVSALALEEPLPSHLPIALDDPLPYLEAFSPLSYTSTITLLPAEYSSPESMSEAAVQPIFQKHFINASHPTGLFTARLEMIVNSSTLSITQVEVPKLDVSAEKELGTFVQDRATGNGTLGKDINVICWAMGRWVEVAIKRATFWCTIENDFSTPEAREKSCRTGMRSKKRKRQGSTLGGDEEPEPEEIEALEKRKWTRRQLLPHMGRTNMDIVSEEVELRFEWTIGFDWTGEAVNTISAAARVPKSWRNLDDRNVLDKVPENFSRLVKDRGPLGAARATVALLMSVDG